MWVCVVGVVSACPCGCVAVRCVLCRCGAWWCLPPPAAPPPPLALFRVWCAFGSGCGARGAPLLSCPMLAALVPPFSLLSLLPLPCGLLVAFGGGPRVGAAYPFLHPCLLGPALLPCAHFALSCPCVAMPFRVPPLLRGPVGQRMGVQGVVCYLCGLTALQLLDFMWRCHGLPICPSIPHPHLGLHHLEYSHIKP